MNSPEENTTQNATSAEQTSIPLELNVPSVKIVSVQNALVQTPEPAINVLKKQLADLQLKVSLLDNLDNKLIQMTEAEIMERIQRLTMEAVNQFLASETPGELPKKVRNDKVQTGHGTITRLGSIL